MPYDDKGPEDSPTPKDRGFNWRSVIYAAIPLGFVAIVLFLMLGGEAVQEAPEEGVVQEFVEGDQADVGE